MIFGRKSNIRFPGGRCGTAKDARHFPEGLIFRVRIDRPRRDPPTGFGNWNSVYIRFRRWRKAGVSDSKFRVLNGEPEFDHICVDGTIMKAHAKATGRIGGGGGTASDAPAAD